MAGGYGSPGSNYKHLSSTELLYDGADSWVTGKALPRTLYAPASVSLADSVLLIGNLYFTVYYDLAHLLIDNCRRTERGGLQA